MDDKNSVLLPHILETLSQKPELCDTYENLCDEIEYVLSRENFKGRSGHIKKALQNALDVGQNLGIITLTDDLIRMPFNMAKSPTKVAPTPKKSIEKSPEDTEYFAMQPRRTHTVKPNLIPHGRSRRRRIARRRSRRVGRRRSRSRRR